MNSNTWLALYEPMLEILTFSGKKYYMKASNKQAIITAMQKKDVLVLPNGSFISWASIDTVDPVSQELSMVEKMTMWLPDYLQDKVKRLVKERKAQEKTVTEQYIQNIIDAG